MVADRGKSGTLRREGRQAPLLRQSADGCCDVRDADPHLADGQDARVGPCAAWSRYVCVTGDKFQQDLLRSQEVQRPGVPTSRAVDDDGTVDFYQRDTLLQPCLRQNKVRWRDAEGEVMDPVDGSPG